MNQRELKERIMSDPDLTVAEKNRMLRDIRAPYYQMSDEELLQLIRDFVAENGRVPERKDLIYDVASVHGAGRWNEPELDRWRRSTLTKKDGAPKGSS